MHPGDLPDSLWNTGLGVSAEHQEPCVETGRWHSPAHSLFRWKLHRCSGTRLGAQGCEGGQRGGGQWWRVRRLETHCLCWKAGPTRIGSLGAARGGHTSQVTVRMR